MPPLNALLWSPRLGKFRGYFEAVLDGPVYIWDLIFPAHFAHKMKLGDWISVDEVKERDNIIVVKKATVITPTPHHSTWKLDVHWIGPQQEILGEGNIALGLDGQGRTLVIQNNRLKKYFGRCTAKTHKVELLPYDGNNSLANSFYDLLNIEPPVTDEEVKMAYRQKAKTTHPDVNPDPGAVAAFQQLSEAYELLKEQDNRDIYDMCLLMANNNFGAVTRDWGEVKVGLHNNAWYPQITSGTIQAAGYQVGSLIVLTELVNVMPIKQGAKTRVAIEHEGMVNLYWTEDL